MMDWQLVFSTINSIVITITLLILVIQTVILRKQIVILQEQTKYALENSGAQSHAEIRLITLKADEIFLQMPQLRKYFYDGVVIEEDNPLYATASAAAELLLDIMEHMLWQANMFPELYIHEKGGKVIWDNWHNYIVDMFVSSPLLVAYIEKRRRWYPPHLIEKMELAKRILSSRSDTISSSQ